MVSDSVKVTKMYKQQSNNIFTRITNLNSVNSAAAARAAAVNPKLNPDTMILRGTRHEDMHEDSCPVVNVEGGSSDSRQSSATTSGSIITSIAGSGKNSGYCPADGLLQFVMPGLEILYWSFLTPSKYRYNCDTRAHVRIDGGILRKAITIVLHISCIFYLWNNVHRLTSSPIIYNSEFGIIYRVLYVCFALLASSFYRILWNHRQCIKWVLGRIDELALELLKDRHCKLPDRRRVRYGVYTMLGVCIGYSLAFTIVHEITHGNMDAVMSPRLFLQTLVYEARVNIHYGTGLISLPPQMTTTNATTITTTTEYGLITSLLIGIPYFIVVQYQTMTWVLAFVMISLWAALFHTVLQTYFESLNKFRTTQRFRLRYLRIFQKITILIEDYNRIFALNTLFSIVACLLFLSVHASSVFTSFSVNICQNLLIGLAIVPIMVTLIVCSEVNNMVHQMSMIIKIYYQQKKLWRLVDAGSSAKSREICQGLGMIQHDLQAQTIGFKGYGFFTISYSFVGTVMSLMVTYSVMFHQWKAMAGVK